jgi:prephenate dehydratase
MSALLHRRYNKCQLCYTGDTTNVISATQEIQQMSALLHRRYNKCQLCYTGDTTKCQLYYTGDTTKYVSSATQDTQQNMSALLHRRHNNRSKVDWSMIREKHTNIRFYCILSKHVIITQARNILQLFSFQ